MYVWEPHKNMRFKKQPGFEAIYHPELKKGTGSGASRWEGNWWEGEKSKQSCLAMQIRLLGVKLSLVVALFLVQALFLM